MPVSFDGIFDNEIKKTRNMNLGNKATSHHNFLFYFMVDHRIMSEHPPPPFVTISYGYLDHFLFSHMHHLKVDSIFRGVLVTLRTIVPQVQKHKCFIL